MPMSAVRHQVLGACMDAWGERWRLRAACRGLPYADILFFPEGRGRLVRMNTLEAKVICHTCPVRRECLRFALDYDIEYGVYGGLTEKERKKLKS